jgi:hypothetical protein
MACTFLLGLGIGMLIGSYWQYSKDQEQHPGTLIDCGIDQAGAHLVETWYRTGFHITDCDGNEIIISKN